jgi:hypothetical protein
MQPSKLTVMQPTYFHVSFLQCGDKKTKELSKITCPELVVSPFENFKA